MTERTGSITDYAMGGSGDTASREGGKIGVSATHALGVRIQGPWTTPADGFNEHVRRTARALAMTGCPTHLASLQQTFLETEDGSEEEKILFDYKDLASMSMARCGAIVQMLVPTEGLLQRLATPSQMAMRALEMSDYLALQKGKIFYTVWERGPVPSDDASVLQHAGQCWVPSAHNRDLLLEAGVSASSIRIVPLPCFVDDPIHKLDGRARVEGPPRFYHIGKWEPRKDQHRILGNFMKAFRPGEAELILKTGAFASKTPGYPSSALHSVHRWTKDPRVQANGWTWPEALEHSLRALKKDLSRQGITLFEERMPEGDIRKLHEIGDVYVSLSHGEGWDMPAFDAKLAANHLLYTPSGGPQEYADDAYDECVPRSGSILCHPLYHWPAGSTYLEYDDEAAIAGFRVLASRVLAATGPRYTLVGHFERFTSRNVGRAMLQHLREIAPGLPGDAGP